MCAACCRTYPRYKIMNEKERRTIYNIPINYQGESRAIRGMFKMRFFVEGLALAIITFIATMKPFGQITDMPLRITVTLLVCMGPFLFGTIGIGGEPITVAIAGLVKWLRSRKVMLYNSNARATTRAQGDIFVEREANRKTIDDVTESVKRKLMRKPTTVYKEGENFEFVQNEYLDDVYEPDHNAAIIVGSIDLDNDDDDDDFTDETEDSGIEVNDESMPIVVMEGSIIFEKAESDHDDDASEHHVDADFGWLTPDESEAEDDEEIVTDAPQRSSGVSFDDVEPIHSEPVASAQSAAIGPDGQPATPAKKKRRRKKKKNPNPEQKEDSNNG